MKAKIQLLLIFFVFIFQTEVYAQSVRLGVPYGHYGNISQLSFSANNQYLLSSSDEGRINVWRLKDSLLMYSYKGVGNLDGTDYSRRTKSQLSASGNYLILADLDSNVLVIDVQSGQTLCKVDHGTGIQDFAVTPDENLLLCQSDRSTLHDLSTGSLLLDFGRTALGKEVNADFFGNSDTIYTYSSGETSFWDASTGKQLATINNRVEAISPDGNYFFTQSLYGGRLSCWDRITFKRKYTRWLGWKYLSSIHCTPDGKVITIDFGGRLQVLDLETGSKLDKLNRSASYEAEISTEARYTAEHIKNYYGFSPVSPYDINEIWIDDVLSNTRINTIDLKAYSRSLEVQELMFSLDEELLAFSLNDGSIMVFNTSGRATPIRLKGQVMNIASLDVGENENKSLVTFQNGSVELYSLNNPQNRHILRIEKDLKAKQLESQKILLYSPDSVHLYSPDGTELLMSLEGELIGHSEDGSLLIVHRFHNLFEVFDAFTGELLHEVKHRHAVDHGLIGADNNTMVLGSSGWKGRAYVYDLSSGKRLSSFKNPIKLYKGVELLDIDDESTFALVKIESAHFWESSSIMEVHLPSGAISDRFDGLSYVYDQAKYLEERNEILLSGKSHDILKMLRNPDKSDTYSTEILGARSSSILSSVNLGRSTLQNISDGSEINVQQLKRNESLKILFLDSVNWIHLHPSGFFDATAGAMKKMYWLQGVNVIDFDQLKHRYWIPGLARKIMDGEPLPEVQSVGQIKLEPVVELGEVKEGIISITLTKRSGSFGDISLFINDKEVEKDILPPSIDTSQDVIHFTYDISTHPYIRYADGGKNKVSVVASSADDFVQGKGVVMEYMVEAEELHEPNFYAIVLGVSDYVNQSINLRYTTQDAEAIGIAVGLGAEELFGSRSHIYSLHSKSAQRPTKTAIKALFDSVSRQAKAEDIILVYLSGHGVNYGGTFGDFYFLTADAISAKASDYSDEYMRQNQAISTTEITEWLKAIAALKQVMIIDACGSGKAVENLIATRNIEASQIRAMDRMKDRTGMFIISGCASDAVSYEASRYGQGLLTYALLQAMKGAALKENRFVDVNTVFQYAREEVPVLARDIQGIQEPQLLIPSSGSFDIGILKPELQAQIPVNQVKPIFVRSMFLDEKELDDVLQLSREFDDHLEQVSYKGDLNIVFRDITSLSNGNRISGIYRGDLEGIKLTCKFNIQGEVHIYEFSAESKDDLISQLYQKLEELL